jgi:hypothetical protein
MFEFLRRRKAPDLAGEVRQQFKDAEQAIGMKWRGFVATVHFKSEIPLADQIDVFAGPVHEYVTAKYPLVILGPQGAGAFWLLVFTAIREAGTHPQVELNAAIAQLKARHASGLA